MGAGAPAAAVIELAPGHKHGLVLASPLMNAAGILGFSREYHALLNVQRLGAFVTNPLTYQPRTPAHPPNAVPVTDGIVIHTGLPNPGVRRALRRWDKEWRRLGLPVILHLTATSPAETARCLDLIERAQGISAIELGLRHDVSAEEAVREVRAALGGPPLIVRLPVERAAELAAAVAQAGADALNIGASPRVEAPAGEKTITGRLYGPACLQAAVEAVRAVAALGLGLPLIGAGGIYSIEDARSFLETGAVAVQIDAAIWTRPQIAAELAELAD
jgi:dihydroorotate dehydrogenase (NAD+) catalytic subunit